ncbi:UDP-2,3-diacylglucosamine diphosphatase [Undibacterium piscinae]|uniref:UDP-2,3-diacylglucosamine hydrolase n=1 Tax=Undibacterium piscinae TaxID=2495591 RepID=A0A6M4A274_9BURK|nr:UDP-2,3-diacylglucosamine diphosphatase [Undibacterium piscinae]
MTNTTAQIEAQPKLVALFASDVHLHPSLPRTTEFFFEFLRMQAHLAEQLYLLGDLFEYWAGDDDMETAYHQQVIAELKSVSNAGTGLFWMAGNRDFLVGERFAKAIGAELLGDIYTANIAGHAITMTHGDAQCTDDTGYMQFRAMVRQTGWQEQFLLLPLTERKTIIEGLRKGSKMEQKEKTAAIMDVNPEAIKQLFLDHHADTLIHGHTHRPARHQHAEGLRYVLPDWECDIAPEEMRGGWLAIYENGEIIFHHLNGDTSSSFTPQINTPP